MVVSAAFFIFLMALQPSPLLFLMAAEFPAVAKMLSLVTLMFLQGPFFTLLMMFKAVAVTVAAVLPAIVIVVAVSVAAVLPAIVIVVAVTVNRAVVSPLRIRRYAQSKNHYSGEQADHEPTF